MTRRLSLFELLIRCVGETKKKRKMKMKTTKKFFRKCFDEFFIHKFRSTLSKSNVFQRGERVLVAFSGGPSSTALLHLIADGLSINARRRLQFDAQVAFIDGKTKVNDVFHLRFFFSFEEHFLYPDARDIKDELKEFIENKLKYPLHILSIDDNDEDFRRLIFDRTKSLTGKEELIRRRRFFHRSKTFRVKKKHSDVRVNKNDSFPSRREKYSSQCFFLTH